MTSDIICKKIAKKFKKTTTIEYEVLLQEARLSLIKNNSKYVPERSSYAMFAHVVITSHLISVLKKESLNVKTKSLTRHNNDKNNYDNCECDEFGIDERYQNNEPSAYDAIEWSDRIKKLTPTAKKALAIVEKYKVQFLSLGLKTEATRVLIGAMVSNYGVSYNKAKNAVNEIRDLVR